MQPSPAKDNTPADLTRSLAKIQARLSEFENVIIPHLDEQARRISNLEKRISSQTAVIAGLHRLIQEVSSPDTLEAS